jgi:SAM-dependent methyltransferase
MPAFNRHMPDPTLSRHRPARRGSRLQGRFWDRIARQYAADPIADMAGYEAHAAARAGLLSPDQSVLEIGCGTGTTALQLAGGTRRMLATDVSPAMIAIARDKLAALPVPQLRFGLAGADDAAAGAVHDTVLAFNLLHWWRSEPRAVTAGWRTP